MTSQHTKHLCTVVLGIAPDRQTAEAVRAGLFATYSIEVSLATWQGRDTMFSYEVSLITPTRPAKARVALCQAFMAKRLWRERWLESCGSASVSPLAVRPRLAFRA